MRHSEKVYAFTHETWRNTGKTRADLVLDAMKYGVILAVSIAALAGVS